MTEDLSRRIADLERKLDNGRFVRKDIHERFEDAVREDITELKGALVDVRAMISADQTERRRVQEAETKARADDRKAMFRMVIAAVLAGGVSIAVTLIGANVV